MLPFIILRKYIAINLFFLKKKRVIIDQFLNTYLYAVVFVREYLVTDPSSVSSTSLGFYNFT